MGDELMQLMVQSLVNERQAAINCTACHQPAATAANNPIGRKQPVLCLQTVRVLARGLQVIARAARIHSSCKMAMHMLPMGTRIMARRVRECAWLPSTTAGIRMVT